MREVKKVARTNVTGIVILHYVLYASLEVLRKFLKLGFGSMSHDLSHLTKALLPDIFHPSISTIAGNKGET